MESLYAPLAVKVVTPHLELHGATDELLTRLLPIVRAGIADQSPFPFDDPMSLYDDNPVREWKWLQSIWRGRGTVTADFWRLYFVVMINGEPVGMQDLIGLNFATFGTVTSFSWLAPTARRRGLGREMRAALLHLAFEGLGAKEASSEAFADNTASNRVSELLHYRRNGTTWATRRGEPMPLNRWNLERSHWELIRRSDVGLVGVEACKSVLSIS